MKRALATALLALAAQGGQGAPLRDPFVPPARAQAQTSAPGADAVQPVKAAPRLRAILFAPGHALADIDGQVLAPGAWFGEWKVARIEERRVTLERGGVRTVLALDREGEQ